MRAINFGKLSKYDLIIFSGSLHAVGINGLKILKQNLSRLANTKIIEFAVGASPPRENVLDETKNKNFSAEEQKNIMFYYFRGDFDYSKLDRVNKILMTLLKVKLSIKRRRTPDEKGMLAAYSKSLDWAKKESTKEIIEYARSLG